MSIINTFSMNSYFIINQLKELKEVGNTFTIYKRKKTTIIHSFVFKNCYF